MISSYPKIFALGTKYIQDIFLDEVEVTEKVDGSQFVFGKINGELQCRSKGKRLILDAPEKLFEEAVEYVLSIKEIIPDNYVFYCEYLKKLKHNVIKYDRIPMNHLSSFAVKIEDEFVNSYDLIKDLSNDLGIETVPLLFSGKINSAEDIEALLQFKSFLGDVLIEGLVVKNYSKSFFIADRLHDIMAGKYVSEKFKEVHANQWKKFNTGKGRWENFIEQFRSEARWDKAIMHLREQGLIEDAPRDIGGIIKEIHRDIIEEEKENIKDYLWNNFNDELLRYSIGGFPEYYKEKIMRVSFDT
uniref:Putative RNA ligase n=1 Tax=viral metagenome TaxID=1070528 RepID=A0A6M3ITX0_9ZZZZ